MDVIILDAHPVEDVRIGRHITYLADQGINVYRIHYNYLDDSAKPGLFSQCGVKGFRINQFLFQGKIRTLYFMGYCLRRKILTECRNALRALDIDPTHPSILHVHDPLLLPLAATLVGRACQTPVLSMIGMRFTRNGFILESPYRSSMKGLQRDGSPERLSFRITISMQFRSCFLDPTP